VVGESVLTLICLICFDLLDFSPKATEKKLPQAEVIHKIFEISLVEDEQEKKIATA
jgi:hypothetical protein